MSRKKSGEFDQLEYIKQYAKENRTIVSVVLSKKYDQDIIKHLEPIKSKSGYIKELIRADIQKGEL